MMKRVEPNLESSDGLVVCLMLIDCRKWLIGNASSSQLVLYFCNFSEYTRFKTDIVLFIKCEY